MQRPRVCREVLMLLASFIRSPLFWSLQRSEPARSHRDNLRETQGYSHHLQSLSCHSRFTVQTLYSHLPTFHVKPQTILDGWKGLP